MRQLAGLFSAFLIAEAFLVSRSPLSVAEVTCDDKANHEHQPTESPRRHRDYAKATGTDLATNFDDRDQFFAFLRLGLSAAKVPEMYFSLNLVDKNIGLSLKEMFPTTDSRLSRSIKTCDMELNHDYEVILHSAVRGGSSIFFPSS